MPESRSTYGELVKGVGVKFKKNKKVVALNDVGLSKKRKTKTKMVYK